MMLLAVFSLAHAVDVDTFEPAGAPLSGGGGLQLIDPTLAPADTWTAGTVLGWAKSPVVSTFPDGGEMSVVSSIAVTHLAGSWSLAAKGARVRIDADVPFYPWVGFVYDNGGVPGRAFGDARVSATVHAWASEALGLTTAVVPALSLPTGATEAWTSAGGVEATLGGAASWAPKAVRGLVVTGNLGVEASPAGRLNDVDFGSGVRMGLGAAWKPLEKRPWRVGVELDNRTTLVPGDGGAARNPTEAHLFTSWAGDEGIQVTLGAGTGLVGGIGTPSVRTVAAIGWRQRPNGASMDGAAGIGAAGVNDCPDGTDLDNDGVLCPMDENPTKAEDKDGFEDGDGKPEEGGAPLPKEEAPKAAAQPAPTKSLAARLFPKGDSDGDAVANGKDLAPDEPEDKDGFEDDDGRPDPDNDGDGSLDGDDKAPNDAEDRDTFEDADGVPDPDNDQDGVLDISDTAPTEPEDKDGFQDGDGAPDPDNDGDGVLDAKDLCPDAPVAAGVAAVEGCPDTDKDGFVGALDFCPDVAPPADQVLVLSRGCAGGAVVARRVTVNGNELDVAQLASPITFLANDTLTPASAEALDALATWLAGQPRAKVVEIAVHTDDRELPAAMREQRTQARADAVRTALLARNVAAERVVAKGYGMAEPLDTNVTAAGRARNIRVEIRVAKVATARRGEP